MRSAPLHRLVPLVVTLALAGAACGGDAAPAADESVAGQSVDDQPVEDSAADDQPVEDSAVEDAAETDEAEEPDVDNQGEEPADEEAGSVAELFPDVLEATARQDGDGSWTFSATLSSPYDTPERYADGWRVLGPDGEVYGTRPLGHDHQAEQPFTRSQSGIEIPEDVTEVRVQGRDQISGWGGATVQVRLER